MGTEIVTAITIALIGVILTGYVSILKRNGWIGKTSMATTPKNITFPGNAELKTQKTTPIKLEAKEPLTEKETKKMENPPADQPTVKPQETPKPQRKNKKPDEPKTDKPAECNNYFGYLLTLPKGTTIPDECYCCTKLIDCTRKQD